MAESRAFVAADAQSPWGKTGREGEVAERLFTPRAQFSGQLLNLGASLAFYFVMRATVPSQTMALWIAVTVVCLGGMAAGHLSFYLFARRGPEGYSAWLRFDRRIAIVNEFAAIATIVLLLPHADAEQRMFATAYFVGYFPCSIFSDPGNVAPNRRAVLLVLTVFAGWLALSGGLASKILAGVVVGYAVFLFYAMGGIAKVVQSAVDARAGMERANALLNRAVAEVSAERDAKTRFIAAASHDLGQPLQAARLFSDQLVRGTANPGATERAQRGLARAIESAQSMLSHMLQHLRLEADAVRPHPEETPVSALLDRVAERFQAQAAAAGCALRTVKCSAVIATDPVLVDRAVGNLVDNAIHHSAGTRILVGARRRRGTIELWVIDDGNGIAPADQATVFDDYTQGADTVAQHRGGFGLGLASVNRVAQLLGGTARFEPRWRNGAAFCIALPGPCER